MAQIQQISHMMQMTRMRRAAGTFCFGVWIAVASQAPPATLVAKQPPPPGEFVPVEEVPPSEQIPAIGLVASAYGFIWVALLGYLWSIGRRLKQVETELIDLESRKK